MTCGHGCHGCCGDHGTSEALREANQRNSTLNSEKTQLQGDLLNKTKEIGEKDKQVAVVGKDLEHARGQLTKTEGELKTEKEKVKELTGLFDNLQIEGSNKDRQIEIQSKDIRVLKTELNKMEEKSLELELKEQERKLNEFIQKLGIGREKPRELQKAYRQLIRAREDYNQNNIDEADDKIEDIKDELLSSG
ncbi:10581_t:CDS:1 [Funneliformis caledonium]|uniref:10581_t:CDS:1 n=1 Tax=Funneliformis caledonium TaxID=1117310 RepID=A0A9N9ISK0_9GLOM|nr:10581_t:CDS:1 [Funneliformis caledonium]